MLEAEDPEALLHGQSGIVGGWYGSFSRNYGMDSMVFGLKSAGLIAHRLRINNYGLCILHSCCQLQRHSQLMASGAQSGIEVALLIG